MADKGERYRKKEVTITSTKMVTHFHFMVIEPSMMLLNLITESNSSEITYRGSTYHAFALHFGEYSDLYIQLIL